MAGSPIKRARREIVEKAALRAAHEHLKMSTADVDRIILEAYETGQDPVLLALPVARALHAKALEGDVPAIKEWNDRVSGKVESHEDRGPVGVTVQILNLLAQPQPDAALGRQIEASHPTPAVTVTMEQPVEARLIESDSA